MSDTSLRPSTDRRLSVLVSVRDEPGALASVLAMVSRLEINLCHVESRPARDDDFDIFLDFDIAEGDPREAVLLDRLGLAAERMMVLDGSQVPWFPRQSQELDRVANETIGAELELESDHPGFTDARYRARRAGVERVARAYRSGQPLPSIAYERHEVDAWRKVYGKLSSIYDRYACAEYRANIALMEQECGYALENVPQLADISRFLEGRTGFALRPTAGLMSSRAFLAGLAFRVFFSTQYIRHESKPFYTPEPDVCHELLGHAPMFADPNFADLSQEIGLASLGASDGEIERLARCYWFSVEFGLVREGSELKAYGAGLLSSIGELEHACSSGGARCSALGRPTFLDWDPAVAAETAYPITEYQPRYFVSSSLREANDRMRRHCESLPRPFYARLNDVTKSIWVDRAIQRDER